MNEPATPIPISSEGAVVPPRLRPGDVVAVVAPCGPPDQVRLERGVRILRELGLEVVTGAHVLDRDRYLAGSDAARAADLQEAWCDPAVAAVFCARGGYGATRTVDLLDWDVMRAAGPKTLVGSSDVTALHRAFAVELGVASLFGPMPACSTISDPGGPEPRTFEHFASALFDAPSPVFGDRVIVPGDVVAPLTGGNLSLLAALCGTPYQLQARDMIVLLEDVAEAPYRIDRMLTQLIMSGALDGAAGFVLGSWVGCGDPYPTLEERLAPLGVPVIAGLPIGHGTPQFSVLLGALGAIDAQLCSLTGSITVSVEAV
ncbi:S66 peptidase family protein [Streptosporangium carneum]|uniref:Muramoyltetrapeptide carboxypeptidase n=1 Tax=Streptosporangium carneum TaxID=47481 RepID=A0A9W6MDI0_9ACTN|nr:LD-carboxypeptidase [Streptosporangium carneum]GLK09940.1 muramoyltetrapeptide carboxypeptidase [Streptosporangium carneum]